MPFCTGCGGQIAGGSKYCYLCGHELGENGLPAEPAGDDVLDHGHGRDNRMPREWPTWDEASMGRVVLDPSAPDNERTMCMFHPLTFAMHVCEGRPQYSLWQPDAHVETCGRPLCDKCTHTVLQKDETRLRRVRKQEFKFCPECLTIMQRQRFQKLDAETRFENYVCGGILFLTTAGIIIFFGLLLSGEIPGTPEAG